MENKYNLLDNPLITYTFSTNNKIDLNITLTEEEIKIFDFIQSTIEKYKLKVEVRIAGGWVRDKVLNLKSHDIDLVISGMKCIEFGLLLNKELNQNEKNCKIYRKENSRKKFDLICVPIFKKKIDIVNIQYNKFKEDSPYEDALKRDITINSLLYNLNEKKVEDFTEKGINDLKNGIINTTIDPYIKLKEEPYLIIRIVRFSIRFNYKIEDNLNKIIIDNINELKILINQKNYYDKIKIEIGNILKLENAYIGIYFFYKFELLNMLYQISNFYPKNLDKEKENINIVNYFIIGHYVFKNKIKLVEKEIAKLNLILLNISFMKYIKSFFDRVTINLNLSNDEVKTKNLILVNLEEYKNIILSENYNRIQIGKIIKKIKYEMIPILLTVIIIDAYFKKFCNNINYIINNINDEFINDLYIKCKKLIEFIEKENLKSVENIIPLISKNELNDIIKINDFEKNKQIFTFMLEKQIEFPNISKNDLIELIKEYQFK